MYTTEELRNLNPERLDLLAEELESGRHVKGECFLAQKGEDGVWKECCMGVGAEVARVNGLELYFDEDENLTPGVTVRAYIVRNSTDYYRETGIFPPAAREWFGFSEADPSLPLPEGVRRAMHPDDEQGDPRWQCMGGWNDTGPGADFDPEEDFTTIAAGVRKLAQLAREAQDDAPEYQHPE